jgi:hypothetical protein
MNPQAEYERPAPEYQEDAEPVYIPDPNNFGEEF